MTAVLIIVAIAIVAGIAISSASKKAHEEEKRQTIERNKQKLQEYEEEQRKAAEQPQPEATEDGETSDEDVDPEFLNLSYEDKMKSIAKDCEKLLFETVASLEMAREEKETLIPKILETVEQMEEETKILKAVVRKLYKNLIANTDDPVRRARYEERFEEEKEAMRDRDYTVLDSDWEQFLDDFEELKEAKQSPKPHRTIGVTVVETRSDEVDGQPCEVANFAVKGLRFCSEDDIKAACTLQVGDPLLMEHEPDNPKDPNAMKVTMTDGHSIGYVDAKCAGYVRDNLSRLVKFVVSKVDDYGDPPYIYAEAFFKKE